MGTILALPTAFVALGILIGTIVSGAFWFVGIFRKEKQSKTKEAEDANQYVIKSLQQKMTILESQVKEQQQQILDMTKQIGELKGENRNLQDLVVIALESYFDRNPEIAQEISQKVK